jgi:RecB family endonuclease NucS
VRLVVARCSVDYVGRLTAHLPMATRLLLIKADGSVSVHADDRAYKPLNWMSPPCWLVEESPTVWRVHNKADEQLVITLESIEHDSRHDLGIDPGLVKDGVEAHLQELLAEQVHLLGSGYSLVRREHPTPIGPVDLLCRPASAGLPVPADLRGEDGSSSFSEGAGDFQQEWKRGGPAEDTPVPDVVRGFRSGSSGHVAVEVKRRAGVDAVEQLTRYLDFLNRDPLLAPVTGVLAAQAIAPQARTLATDRGIVCVVLDYDAMRGMVRDDVLF